MSSTAHPEEIHDVPYSTYVKIWGTLIALTAGLFKAVPSGFVPGQDKQYLIGFAQLPDAASLDRTDAVIRQMSDIAKDIPGVENSISFPGLSGASQG